MKIKVLLQNEKKECVELIAPIEEYGLENFSIISVRIYGIGRDFADEYKTIGEINELYYTIGEECVSVIQTMLNARYSMREIEKIIKDGNYTVYDADNMAGVAEQICEECGWLSNLPEHLQGYIDYQRLGRDIEVEGEFLNSYLGFIVEIFH